MSPKRRTSGNSRIRISAGHQDIASRDFVKEKFHQIMKNFPFLASAQFTAPATAGGRLIYGRRWRFAIVFLGWRDRKSRMPALQPVKDLPTVTREGERLGPRIEGVLLRRAITQTDERGTLCEILNPGWEFTRPRSLTFINSRFARAKSKDGRSIGCTMIGLSSAAAK